MKTRNLCLAIVAGFALQACNSAPVNSDQIEATTASPKCKAKGNKSHCDITVIVSEPDEKSCAVQVATVLEEVEFLEPNTPKKVSWSLVGAAGYTFPLNGIFFKNDPNNVFDMPDRKHQNKTFEFRNRHPNSTDQPYRYGITVGKGSILCSVDPTIRNR